MAFCSGLVQALFGELKNGFDAFVQRGEWHTIASTVETVHPKAANYTEGVVDLYTAGCEKDDLPWARAAIEETLYERGVPKKTNRREVSKTSPHL